MNNFIIKSNNEVDANLLDKVLEFDRKIFPSNQDYSFPDDYLKKLYSNSKDGIFVLLDNDLVIGYVNCIFLSDQVLANYLSDKDYLKLENIGLNVGDNNMYFYTVAVSREYRDTNVIKMLMASFATWLNNQKNNGKNINRCISEVITEDGKNVASIMGMIPFDVDSNGFGIYYSQDGLENYLDQMKQYNEQGTRKM